MHTSRRRTPTGSATFVVGLAAAIVLALVAVPLAAVFAFAVEGGLAPIAATLARPDVHAALRLSAIAAACTVPFVTIFGTAAAWVVTRTDLPGRSLLAAALNVPFSIPPVVSELLIILTLDPHSPINT
jgi:sulfate transport system permease protein